MALTSCLLIAAALVLLAIPLANGAVAGAATGWGDAPIAAFIFPLIGLFLAPIYPTINSLILNPAALYDGAILRSRRSKGSGYISLRLSSVIWQASFGTCEGQIDVLGRSRTD